MIDLKPVVALSTMPQEIEAAQALANGRVAEAQANSRMSQYVSAMAEAQLETLEYEKLARQRQVLLSVLESFGEDRSAWSKKTTAELLKKVKGVTK